MSIKAINGQVLDGCPVHWSRRVYKGGAVMLTAVMTGAVMPGAATACKPFKQHAAPRLLSIIHKTTLLLWAPTNDVSWPPLTFKIMIQTQASHSAADALIESNVTSFRDHYSFMTPSTESLYRLVHG
jgi:hypothetical protein